jgi:hypothetical protein
MSFSKCWDLFYRGVDSPSESRTRASRAYDTAEREHDLRGLADYIRGLERKPGDEFRLALATYCQRNVVTEQPRNEPAAKFSPKPSTPIEAPKSPPAAAPEATDPFQSVFSAWPRNPRFGASLEKSRTAWDAAVRALGEAVVHAACVEFLEGAETMDSPQLLHVFLRNHEHLAGATVVDADTQATFDLFYKMFPTEEKATTKDVQLFAKIPKDERLKFLAAVIQYSSDRDGEDKKFNMGWRKFVTGAWRDVDISRRFGGMIAQAIGRLVGEDYSDMVFGSNNPNATAEQIADEIIAGTNTETAESAKDPDNESWLPRKHWSITGKDVVREIVRYETDEKAKYEWLLRCDEPDSVNAEWTAKADAESDEVFNRFFNHTIY